MAKDSARAAVGWVLFGITSTSTRATTRCPGRTPGNSGWRMDTRVRPGQRAVRATPGRGDAEQAPSWSRSRARAGTNPVQNDADTGRHAMARDTTQQQVAGPPSASPLVRRSSPTTEALCRALGPNT